MAFRSLALLSPLLGLGTVDVPSMEIAPGVQMPVLSIGTGGVSFLKTQDVKDIVTGWVGQGGTGIDTAWVYGTQGAVKEALASAGVAREEVFIATKIPLCFGADLFEAWDQWLLSTDYIDLLLIHSDFGDCRITWGELERRVASGKIRAIGTSNFGASALERLVKHATIMPAVNQIKHTILKHNDETVDYCRAHNITVMAYAPLGESGNDDVVHDDTVRAIAASHNVSGFQVGLKWIVQSGHILTFSSTNPLHQASDADIFNFELTDEEMATLDSLQQTSGVLV